MPTYEAEFAIKVDADYGHHDYMGNLHLHVPFTKTELNRLDPPNSLKSLRSPEVATRRSTVKVSTMVALPI